MLREIIHLIKNLKVIDLKKVLYRILLWLKIFYYTCWYVPFKKFSYCLFMPYLFLYWAYQKVFLILYSAFVF